jgi:hypothetical protein
VAGRACTNQRFCTEAKCRVSRLPKGALCTDSSSLIIGLPRLKISNRFSDFFIVCASTCRWPITYLRPWWSNNNTIAASSEFVIEPVGLSRPKYEISRTLSVSIQYGKGTLGSCASTTSELDFSVGRLGQSDKKTYGSQQEKYSHLDSPS